MKTSLDHLPLVKQVRIRQFVEIIVEKVQPEKVILFGSYATNKWVEDEQMEDGIWLEYRSDYDFLVITKEGERRSDYEVQEMIEKRSGIREPVSAITHDIGYVNGKLSDGQYFFVEIQQQGILLYDAGNTPLAERRVLTSVEKKAFAQRDFDKWFPRAKRFLMHANIDLEDKELKMSCFFLHQAAENTYNSVILVFRGYKPKTHNLEKLYRYAKHYSKDLAAVFPQNTDEEVYLFGLLRKGYVEARYDEKFSITEAELVLLMGRIEQLQVIALRICEDRIATFGENDGK